MNSKATIFDLITLEVPGKNATLIFKNHYHIINILREITKGLH